MNRYSTSADNIVIRAPDARTAAGIIARRIYGRRGACASLRLDCRTEDGRDRTYEAFVGRRYRNAIHGRNVRIYEHTPAPGGAA